MRLGKIAAAAAGSLVVGAMGLPGLTSAAHAAPTTAALQGALQCSYSSFKLPYDVDAPVSVDGTAVSVQLNDIAAAGFPEGLKTHGFKVSLVVTINGEKVTLTGENTYGTPIAGGADGPAVAMPMPVLTGVRTGTADAATSSITSADIKMKAAFSPAPLADNQLYCAPVAPKVALTCTFGSYKLNYSLDPRITITSLGSGQTAVKGKVANLALPNFNSNMPSFLTVTKAKATVNLLIGTDPVAVVSEKTYSPVQGGADPVSFGVASGQRAETIPNPTGVSISSVDFVITAGPTAEQATDNPINCVPAVATSKSAVQAFTCAFQSFKMSYKVNAEATVKGDGVAVTLADVFHPGMPDFIPVNGITANLGATINGEAVAVTGTTTYAPARKGNEDFVLPTLTGTRAKALDISTLAIDSLALSVKSAASDNAITCVKGAMTKTTAVVTSPAANKVTLTATIDDATAAGTVEFKEGATKVATATVAAGKATATLSGVKAGAHVYTATFVPADAAAFGTSTSAAASVTVKNPVVKTPVVVAKATKSITKATYNKKKKTAAVVTTVKAGSASASGTVKVTVKLGKKVIASKSIKLKSGKVALSLSKKQLKKKGTYTVTTSYAGNTSFKASTSKKTFKVK